MSVGLVVVSHSARIAEGVVELAAQMAPGVRIEAAGGTADGGLGTDFDRISAALTAADGGDGVVVLADLGSAVLTAETAVDFLDDEVRARAMIADAPLVEGSVAAAVAAAIGGDVAAVRAAAEGAGTRGAEAEVSGASTVGIPDEASSGIAESVHVRRVVLRNVSGLHARPAAELVTTAGRFDAAVRVDGVDAASLLSVLALGAGAGSVLELRAEGPEAEEALDAISALIDSGFGEELVETETAPDG